MPGDVVADTLTSEHRVAGAVTGNGLEGTKVTVGTAVGDAEEDGSVCVPEWSGSTRVAEAKMTNPPEQTPIIGAL